MTKTFCAAALAALVLPAFAAEWMTDLDAAKAKAAAEGKAVLVDFTGSDWCQWCILLKKEVFDKPAFEQYAKDRFVLMEVDIPNNPSFDPQLRERNIKLSEEYRINGFPTVMVMTPAGEVVGGFEGGQPNVAAARGPLDAALANARALKAAKALKGDAQVKALYAVYEKLPESFRAVGTLRHRIAELDRSGLTDIDDDIKAQDQLADVVSRLRAAGQDGKAMLSIVDGALKKGYAKNRRALLEMKSMAQLMAAETEADILAAKATLLEAAEAAPGNAAAALRAEAERRFANPARVLQNVKRSRGK